MSVHTDELLKEDPAALAREIVGEFRQAILAGRPWYLALLDAIARWRLPHEWVVDRYYCYLVGGEAFDWLLLAERLLESVADLVPEEAVEALLFHGQPPLELSLAEFRCALGESKYQAHLNYLYGVIVEEALQLAVEEDVHKELRCRVWGQDQRVDENVFQRIYNKSKESLLTAFREERGFGSGDTIGLAELREFTYWLFQYRMRQCDRAKVASDTRRGLAQISRIENQSRLCHKSTAPLEEPAGLIDGLAVLA